MRACEASQPWNASRSTRLNGLVTRESKREASHGTHKNGTHNDHKTASREGLPDWAVKHSLFIVHRLLMNMAHFRKPRKREFERCEAFLLSHCFMIPIKRKREGSPSLFYRLFKYLIRVCPKRPFIYNSLDVNISAIPTYSDIVVLILYSFHFCFLQSCIFFDFSTISN